MSTLGAAVLIGWHAHLIPIIQMLPTLAPMQRMTALGFLVSGIALILAAAGYRRATMICAVVVLVEATLVCLEYALHTSFGIDQLLGPDYINIHTSHLGRMSPVTALCFLASSMALLAIASRRPAQRAPAIGGIAASILIAVGTVSVLGYLLGHTEAYGWSHFTRMALHTSASFVVIGVGLLTWAWQESHVKKGAPEWLPLSLGLGLSAGALGIWQALMAHKESDLPLLSGVILGGGLLGSLLVAITIAQALQARRSSHESQEGREVLERVFEAPPDALLLTDRQGRILRANRQVKAIFGYTSDELVGTSIEALVPLHLSARHRIHREGYYASPSARRMGWGLDLRGRRKDGAEFPVEISLGPVQSGGETQVLAVVRDVTERQQAQEALRLSEERFRSVFENGALGATLVGNDHRMIEVNPALCRMLGYSEEELTRMTPLEITHPDDRDSSLNLMEQLFTGEVAVDKIEKRYMKKNGEVIWASLSASLIRDRQGRPLYAVGIVEDISERKRVEAVLRLGNEIIANIEEGLCLVRTSDSTIVFANPKFEKMFGYGAGELAGKHVASINAPTDKSAEEVAQEIIAELMRQDVWRGEILNRRKNGTPFLTSATISNFDHPRFGKVWVSVHQDITERKLAEHKLTEQAALLNLAHDAIFVCDPEDKITFWNRGATEAYGWPPEEAVGRVARALLKTKFPVPRREIERALETKGQWEGELEHTARDGETIIAASRWSLQRNERGVPSAVLQINRDITLRKLAEAQLHNLTERLSLATRTASIGIWDLDLRTKRAVWDDTSFEIFGMAKVNPVAYEDFARRVHSDDLAAVEASLQRAIEGKTQDSVEFRIHRPDGSMRHVSSAEGAVLDEQGNVVRLVGTAIDITARKEMEEQIEASRVQMAASARLSAVGMMAGGVAHEINNPLAIIHASASDMLRRIKEEGVVPLEIAKRDSERILHTANRITRIIKSMRHLAREGSQDSVHPASVAKIVEEALEMCEERFKYHSIHLLLPRIDPALKVSCREVQIGQVLLNLLQNAFDAVVEQPGEKWIRLDVTPDNGFVVLSVIDSGPGVPPELKPRIMEPFFTTKDVGKGTGLGLSLSRTIVEEHGSKLELTDKAGHPCFSFRLPLSRKEEPVCN